MKFSFELQKMPTTAKQKGVSYKNGNHVFYNRKGIQNYELQGALKKVATRATRVRGG